MNSDSFYQIEVSWDEKLLKRRSMPQAVKITTPGFFKDYYPQLYYWDWTLYFADKGGFYRRIPSPLMGKMEYKEAIDFMESIFLRIGIVACVSKKVKDILLEEKVAPDSYYLIPIELVNGTGEYYVLFIPFLSLSELQIDYTSTHFIAEGKDIAFHDDHQLSEYLSNRDNPLRPTNLCLDASVKVKDIINAGYIHGNIYFSERIIKAFHDKEVVGYTAKRTGSLGTCPLSFRYVDKRDNYISDDSGR